MSYRAPKTIITHPGVEACDSGHDGGSDYAHDVLLREGWAFQNGRMAGSRVGFFHSVADFRDAAPARAPASVVTLGERLMPGCTCGASPESNRCSCD